MTAIPSTQRGTGENYLGFRKSIFSKKSMSKTKRRNAQAGQLGMNVIKFDQKGRKPFPYRVKENGGTPCYKGKEAKTGGLLVFF